MWRNITSNFNPRIKWFTWITFKVKMSKTKLRQMLPMTLYRSANVSHLCLTSLDTLTFVQSWVYHYFTRTLNTTTISFLLILSYIVFRHFNLSIFLFLIKFRFTDQMYLTTIIFLDGIKTKGLKVCIAFIFNVLRILFIKIEIFYFGELRKSCDLLHLHC